MINYPSQVLIHRLPGKISGIHRKFGLWICLRKDGLGSESTYETTPPRKFEFYSLAYLISGNARLWEAQSKTERNVVQGELVLLPPDLINRYGRTDSNFLEDAVCFCGPVADALFESGTIATGIFTVDQLRPLQEIINLASNPAPQKQIEANIKLLDLLIRLKSAPEPGKKRLQRRNARLDSLLAEFTADSSQFRTVEEMAAWYGCKPEQFRIVFKEYTGMLPKEYIDQAKIIRAREQLLNSTLSIAEIAAGLEFHDQFHFSRAFKKKTGFPPSEFRAKFSEREDQP